MGYWGRQFIPLSLWAITACILLYMVSIDLYNQEQFILGVATLSMIYLLREHYMRTLNKPESLRFTRLVLLILAGVLALRYLIWRVQYSIPWYNDAFSLILSLILLAAEAFAISLYFMGVFTVIHPLRREPVPLDMTADDLPTVDIFVPTYNESADLLRTTLLAASSILYPKDKLNIYLLDDGGTDVKCLKKHGLAGETARQRKKDLQLLCAKTGACYLTRSNNNHAKAGNINAALTQTSGDIIVVFDSDHVPTMDFLTLTVGTMLNNPNIALIQTPHYMINQDPLEKSVHATHQMPSEGDMFYSLNLRGMDNWNAGFFCGSGALILRSALEKIDGICTDTIVEDADSSMTLLSKGYDMAYLHIPVLAGLSSESIDALVVQRSRWATGMIQLFRMKNPLFRKGLSFSQRLCYINCIAYWFFVLARIVFLFTPIFALFFGIVFFAAPPSEIMLYLIPYIIGLYLVLNVMYGRVRWTFVSDIYDTFSAVLLAGTVAGTLIKPGHKAFEVTPKAITHKGDSLSFLSSRFYIVIAIQVAASIYGVQVMMNDPSMYNQMFVSLAWNAYNMLFTIAVLGVLIERHETRCRPRIQMNEAVVLHIEGQSIACHIDDMTEDGAMLRMPGNVPSFTSKEGVLTFVDEYKDTALTHRFEIEINIKNMYKKPIKNDQRMMIGIAFDYANMEQRRNIINYLYGHSERWQHDLMDRHQHSTVTQGFLFLLRALGYGLVHIGMLISLPFKRKKMAAEESSV